MTALIVTVILLGIFLVSLLYALRIFWTTEGAEAMPMVTLAIFAGLGLAAWIGRTLV